jgi:hypothetical protein
VFGRIKENQKFGRWTAIRFDKQTAVACFWWCKCKCGTERSVRSGDLRNGASVSCGCYSREVTSKIRKTHGQSLPDAALRSEYKTWKGIKSRCYRKTSSDFYLYGARGIRVCKRWKNSFENFIKDMGKKPSPVHSIERKNNNGNYTPKNCKWATVTEQANNRRNNSRFCFNGQNLTLAQWSKKLGIPASCLYDRIFRNWTLKRTFTTPSRNALKEI